MNAVKPLMKKRAKGHALLRAQNKGIKSLIYGLPRANLLLGNKNSAIPMFLLRLYHPIPLF